MKNVQMINIHQKQLIFPNRVKASSRSTKIVRPNTSLNFKRKILKTKEEKNNEWNTVFEKIIKDSSTKDPSESIESNICPLFHCQRCIFWFFDTKNNILVSKTYKSYCNINSSLQGFVLLNRTVISIINKINTHGRFKDDSKLTPNGAPVIMIPIYCYNNPCGVIQLIREPMTKNSFEKDDNECAEFLSRKFNIYGGELFKMHDVSGLSLYLFTQQKLCNEDGSSTNQKCEANPVQPLRLIFNCEEVDVYKFDLIRGKTTLYDDEVMEMETINSQNCGIANFCATEKKNVNVSDAKQHSSFVEEFDGIYEGATLCVFYEISPKIVWTICLRGRKAPFSYQEELSLQALIPFVVKSIIGFFTFKPKTGLGVRLMTLLMFIGMLNSNASTQEDLCKNIEEITKTLVESEKSIFFLYDKENHKFISKWIANKHQETDDTIGFAAEVMRTKEAINLSDPHASPKFNPRFDSYEGYEDKCILGKSVYGINGKFYGVILAIGNPASVFEENDVIAMNAVAVVAGIALQNQEVNQNVLNYNQLTYEFITNQATEEEFVRCSMKCCNLTRVTLFSVSSNKVKEIKNFGKRNKVGNILAKECVEEKEKVVTSAKELEERNILYMDKLMCNDSSNIMTKCITNTDTIPERAENAFGVIDKPIYGTFSNSIIGVIEVEFIGKYIKSIDEISEIIKGFIVKNNFNLSSDDSFDFNEKLDNQNSDIFDLSFDYHKIPTEKSSFIYASIFKKLGILNTFKVRESEISKFIVEVLKKTGADNGRLLDIFQFASYVISSTKYYSIIGMHKTYAMLLAILLRNVSFIDSLKLLEKYEISGSKDKKVISRFIKDVIVYKRDSEIKKFMESIDEIKEVFASGEFDPMSTEDHMDIVAVSIAAISQCGILVRPQANRESVDTLYNEYTDYFSEYKTKSYVINTVYLPLLDILAKEINSLASVVQNVRESIKKML